MGAPSPIIEDVLAPGLALVFCGTALGRISAERRAYYANPGNYFWRTLHDVGLTPERIEPANYANVLRYGIGLTDLCKTHFGQDAELPASGFDTAGLAAKIDLFQPAHLAFTSKTAASIFLDRPTGQFQCGPLGKSIGKTEIWALPSPSGQARRYWDTAPWQALADAVSSAHAEGSASSA
ncbi:mismatch-specific DNA-glycosylase [Notoacmeibacter sp. MSK16QG-6]|uniref:mismatch-specific DNA-glycosylase n=1 Tax=Notoacmeibacter sp. MSK16QG-6 TaxID=2957982 RepID=UPI00209F2EAF|nr:mismatch-specific DNA-glycosylase [Notoacmeibacter sp. MSK16QG-6]MCP1197973.1 mismatch-specific DNA-glycosylase [Notoacmeibacter sp. MSK16QG-6]